MESDIKPYEKIKIRCLNGGHSALGYAGALAGFETIDDAASDDLLQSFLKLYFQEVSVTLDPVKDYSLLDYQKILISRFTNHKIKDDVMRICKDGSSKIPGFFLPTISEVFEKGERMHALCFVVASWICFIEKQKQLGFALDDGENDTLFNLVDKMSHSGNVQDFLGEERLFGELGKNDTFVDHIQKYHSEITAHGITVAITNLLEKD